MSSVVYIFPPEEAACRTLWLAVIHLALFDLVHDGNQPDDTIIRLDAYRWFFLSNATFNVVCDLAGVDASAIRTRARLIKENPNLLGNPHV